MAVYAVSAKQSWQPIYQNQINAVTKRVRLQRDAQRGFRRKECPQGLRGIRTEQAEDGFRAAHRTVQVRGQFRRT